MTEIDGLSARVERARAISRLYSTEPRRSGVGEQASAASRAASAMTASAGRLPTSASSASRERTGVGATLVRASPTWSNAPFVPSVTCAAAAAVA